MKEESIFEVLSKYILVLFGVFFIVAGFVMLLRPEKVRNTVRKAGSTTFINYAELSIRMVPGLAFIMFAEHSNYGLIFRIIGWFMIFSSILLMIIPRKTHHGFSVRCADIIKPVYFQLISPLSMVIGVLIINAVME